MDSDCYQTWLCSVASVNCWSLSQLRCRRAASMVEAEKSPSAIIFHSACWSACRRCAGWIVNCCSPASTNPRNRWFYHPNCCDNTPMATPECPTLDSASTLCAGCRCDASSGRSRWSWMDWAATSPAPTFADSSRCWCDSRRLQVTDAPIWWGPD